MSSLEASIGIFQSQRRQRLLDKYSTRGTYTACPLVKERKTESDKAKERVYTHIKSVLLICVPSPLHRRRRLTNRQPHRLHLRLHRGRSSDLRPRRARQLPGLRPHQARHQRPCVCVSSHRPEDAIIAHLSYH